MKFSEEDCKIIDLRDRKAYYLNGMLVKYIWLDGGEEWFFNNKRHRDGGPAVIDIDGEIIEYRWFKFGKMHREDGPALERAVHKEYWINGKRHRLDGPAIESNTVRRWFINGEEILPTRNDNFERLIKLKSFW